MSVNINSTIMKMFLITILVILICSCTTSPTEKHQNSRNNIVNVQDKVKEIIIDEPLISSYSNMYMMDKYLIITDWKAYDKQIQLCRSAALLPLSPLRTVRATFTAYSSDNSKFNSHKIKSAHIPLLRVVVVPIKLFTHVVDYISVFAFQSRYPKSGQKDWLHTLP